MFFIAITLGIYSYIIFFLGLSGLLYKNLLVLTTLIYIVIIIYIFKDKIKLIFVNYKFTQKNLWLFLRDNKLFVFILSLLLLQALINLVGALGPELAFDALWYHLTLPKIYLNQHKIFYIPGGLLYYSAMPKLTEMFYIVSIAVHGEMVAKIVHFTFGILCVFALFLFSKKYFSNIFSIIISLIFYSNLVVAWESITAYIDLTRTFYEIMALWAFMIWSKTNRKNWLIVLGVMVGFAIAVKLLAIGTILIFSLLIIFKKLIIKNSLKIVLSELLIFFVSISISISPWLIFSLITTGNPIHPIFNGYKVDIASDILSPIRFFRDVLEILLFAQDPISPVYLVSIPLVIYYFNKFRSEIKWITIYSVIALIIWYFTPRTGGGRFIMPYLPAFSILIGEVIRLSVNKKTLKSLLLVCIILISCISITYRALANSKYVPVLVGLQNKQSFLVNKLNFSYGDFYDIDGYFSRNITDSDKVLLYGFHNLYYVNFPFIDSSWVKKGDKFNYIATQNANLPKRFKAWDLLYVNSVSKVFLYTKNKKYYSY